MSDPLRVTCSKCDGEGFIETSWSEKKCDACDGWGTEIIEDAQPIDLEDLPEDPRYTGGEWGEAMYVEWEGEQ